MKKIKEIILQNKLHTEERPFFVYDFNQIKKNLENIQNLFSTIHKDFAISFSLKTNPNLHIIKKLSSECGLGFDVSSLGELEFLNRAGIDFSKVSVSGPGKTDECLNLAVQLGVRAIHIESVDELKVLPQNLKCLSFRVRTSDIYAAKLGMNDGELETGFRMLGSRKLIGLHAYLGRESFSFERYHDLLRKLLVIQEKYKSQLSEDFSLFIGPGLPHSDFTLTNVIKIDSRCQLEVGRALIASAGYYFTQVLGVKTIRNGRKNVIIEGGLQHLGSPMVSLNQGLMNFRPIYFRSEKYHFEDAEFEEASVFGSLCLWHDNLHPKMPIPHDLSRGDWIGFSMAGAYGLTAGVPHFIGQALPKEYLLEDNCIREITAAGFRSYHNCFEAPCE